MILFCLSPYINIISTSTILYKSSKSILSEAKRRHKGMDNHQEFKISCNVSDISFEKNCEVQATKNILFHRIWY